MRSTPIEVPQTEWNAFVASLDSLTGYVDPPLVDAIRSTDRTSVPLAAWHSRGAFRRFPRLIACGAPVEVLQANLDQIGQTLRQLAGLEPTRPFEPTPFTLQRLSSLGVPAAQIEEEFQRARAVRSSVHGPRGGDRFFHHRQSTRRSQPTVM